MNKDSDNKYTKFDIIFESFDKSLNKDIYIHNILTCLTNINLSRFSNTMLFYLIAHDKDENKRLHYHLVIELSNKYKLREYTLFNLIKSNLECSDEVITLEHCKKNCCIGAVQYLIHKHNPEKFQYNEEDIITNNPNRLKYLLEDIGLYDLTTFELIEVIEMENSFTDIIKRIGLNNFSRYNATIKMLYQEKYKYE